jgi:hypothetical protein
MTRSALRARQSAPSTRGKSRVSAEAACENLHNTFPRERHYQNEAKAPRRARQRTNSVGVFTRIAQRLLAMAACIWCNWSVSIAISRSLIVYGH